MIKLIASDLDGTLLRNGSLEIPTSTISLIKALQEKGVRFIAASGRQYSSIRTLFSSIQDEIGYIAENGSLAFYKDTLLSKTSIDPELCTRILQFLKEHHYDTAIVSGVNTLYTDCKDEAFIEHIRKNLKTTITVVDDMLTDIPEPFLKIAFYQAENILLALEETQKAFAHEIKTVTAGNDWIDFIAPGSNKGVALTRVLEHFQIDPKDCIAFGDQHNDIEMLELAGIGYAMDTAAPGVADHANCVTENVDLVLQQILDELS